MSKVCKLCNIDKQLTEYYRSNNALMARCKACHQANVKRNYVKCDNVIEKLSKEKKQLLVNFIKFKTPLNIMSKELGISIPTIRKYQKNGFLETFIFANSSDAASENDDAEDNTEDDTIDYEQPMQAQQP